jgi:hypothetical protein
MQDKELKIVIIEKKDWVILPINGPRENLYMKYKGLP